MPAPDLVIRAHRVALPETFASVSVHIRDGRITDIKPFDDIPASCKLIEARDDSILMPGLVDTHVHINEPGRTEWEGFETATRAAAAGGVTTLIEMPLNSIPPTTTLAGLHAKIEAARAKCHVDVGFWAGVVPGNVLEIERLFEAGVFGFKCFLIHSGVDEFPNVTESDLREVMPLLAQLKTLLIVHAEVPGPVEQALNAEAETQRSADARSYATFLRSRPKEAEDEAVALMIRLSRKTGARVHIVHHCSANALEAVRAAKAAGVQITLETCPHYLSFNAEEIPDGATEFKCCPPIRERENNEKLWAALDENLIEMIVSDHSPCPPEMKLRETGDFMAAWGGISSLQLRLPIIWTEAARRGYTIHHLLKWLAHAPAQLVGLEQRKGSIDVGMDADLSLWNPDATFRVEPAMLQHRHKLTPYAGRTLRGIVEKTFLRGELIYDQGRLADEPKGMLLKRED
jgi:allantoinase